MKKDTVLRTIHQMPCTVNLPQIRLHPNDSLLIVSQGIGGVELRYRATVAPSGKVRFRRV